LTATTAALAATTTALAAAASPGLLLRFLLLLAEDDRGDLLPLRLGPEQVEQPPPGPEAESEDDRHGQRAPGSHRDQGWRWGISPP